jgi:4-amino-4-deoxy-L-arabinose transferase-like glycosyltransferase
VYVVRLWTTIFPVDDWSFYLLGMTNAAIAVWVAWRLSALLLSEEKRVVGLAFLTLVPFFNFFSLNYNHNTLLMPLWAMTTLFFLRSFQTRHLGFAALAGLAAGMAMLGKYWTFTLLAGLALAALIDPRRRVYFTSAAPYITILAGGLIIGPHLVWLYQNHYTTLAYPAIVHGETSIAAAGVASLKYFLAFALYPVVPIAITAIATRPSRAALYDTLLPSTLDRRLIAVMFWSPVLLPIPIAILDRLHLVTLYTIPALTLLPVVLLGSPLLNFTTKTCIRITGFAVMFPFLALLSAPLVALNVFLNHSNATHSPYYRLLSAAAQQIWRSATDQPLRLVVGDQDCATGIAFYSTDHPDVNPRSPMAEQAIGRLPMIITDSEKIRHSGMIVVCKGTASECGWLRSVSPLASQGQLQEVTLMRSFLGWSGKPATFSIVAVPPRS